MVTTWEESRTESDPSTKPSEVKPESKDRMCVFMCLDRVRFDQLRRHQEKNVQSLNNRPYRPFLYWRNVFFLRESSVVGTRPETQDSSVPKGGDDRE